MQLRYPKALALVAIVGASVLAVAAPLGAAEQNAYNVTNLVSNSAAIPAAIHDTSLRNAWGLTASSSSPWWVADNATDVSTLYNGNPPPAKVPLTVSVPTAPTGTVFNIANPSGAFPVTGGTSRFLFATEHGRILGWPGSGAARVSAAQSFASGAIYKGLAIASTPAGPRVYATDFHNGRVDVWDGSWNLVDPTSSFIDPAIPAGLRRSASSGSATRSSSPTRSRTPTQKTSCMGQGLGFVDAYDTAGNLQGRVAQHGQLNAPWGSQWLPRASVGSPAPCSSATSATADPRLRRVHRAAVRPVELRDANGQADRDRRPLGARVRERRHGRPKRTLFFTAGPERRDARTLRRDRPELAGITRPAAGARPGALSSRDDPLPRGRLGFDR